MILPWGNPTASEKDEAYATHGPRRDYGADAEGESMQNAKDMHSGARLTLCGGRADFGKNQSHLYPISVFLI